MRRLYRLPLSKKALKTLAGRADKVTASSTPGETVVAQWSNRSIPTFDEIRSKLKLMAPNEFDCMYCERNEATDIEHFRPKSTYPAYAFEWENYLWACSSCNSNYKRTLFPCDDQGKPQLIDPTVEDPEKHLTFIPKSGDFNPKHNSEMGDKSIDTLGLNRLSVQRKDAWISLQSLLVRYRNKCIDGHHEEAESTRRTICRNPFLSLLTYLRDMLQDTQRATQLVKLGLVDQACFEAYQQHPEINDWLTVQIADNDLLQPLLGEAVIAAKQGLPGEYTFHIKTKEFVLHLSGVPTSLFKNKAHLKTKKLLDVQTLGEETHLIFDHLTVPIPHTAKKDQIQKGTMFFFDGSVLRGAW